MAKVSRIMKLSFYEAQFSIEFHTGGRNPFRLYKHGWKTVTRPDGSAYPQKTKTLVEKYANLDSCFYCLREQPEYKAEAWKDVF